MSGEQRHDPTYLSGGGMRWCICSCGWQSDYAREGMFAQLQFAGHLVKSRRVAT